MKISMLECGHTHQHLSQDGGSFVIQMIDCSGEKNLELQPVTNMRGPSVGDQLDTPVREQV